jgi:sulfite reductase (NADPH) flavoprotein alpha-component
MNAAAPLLPPSPLADDQKAQLLQLINGLDTHALWWLSGYSAGLAQAQPPRALALVAPGQVASGAVAKERLTILYGSQTGNAKRCAERLLADAEAAGVPVRLLRADAYPTRELADERWLYVVISTQGEGDPPDDAIGFIEFLNGRRAPKLAQLRFSVLGLGDSSYADFCGIGRKLDARLAELGGQRVVALAQADVDFDTIALPWHSQVLEQARTQIQATPTASSNVTPLRHAVAQALPQWTQANPFVTEVLANQRLTGREFKGTGFRKYGDNDKDVRHIELSLEGSGLTYEPGDSLGIRHRNPQALVEAVLEATGLDSTVMVELDGNAVSLGQSLEEKRELSRLSRPFLTAVAEHVQADDLKQLLEPGNAQFAGLVNTHQLIDVLRRWSATWDAQALVKALRAPTQRLYSIASSRKRVGEEAHLTLDVLRYQAHGHAHLGAASGFLAALDEGGQVPVYVEANERFRVPADASRDIIMVGPGTGIAPFRGFVQERAETGASGRNWLFFGAQHFNTGFVYQTEWQDALAKGELQRLDLAFSRDQAEKIYVQHRLREQGRELYDWLQNGAHFYVCGAIGMGKDVHAALLDIITTHNGGDADAATEFLATLQREGRYARDVY